MQCPSCQFENMPGSQRCARCAAALTIQSSEIDIHPPRASSWERRLPTRQLAAVQRAAGSISELFVACLGVRRTAPNFGGSPLEYLCLAVPGLHQRLHGEPQRGTLMFAIFLALLFLSLVFAGTVAGSLLMGVMFAWHVATAVDAVIRDFSLTSDRLIFTAAVASAICLVIYLPGVRLIQRVAAPMSIAMQTQHFNAGDVIWYNQSATPQVGDLVLYELPASGTAPGGRYNMQYLITGMRINRLVATAGQSIRMQDGVLIVDHEVSPWQPTGGFHLDADREIIVRPDHVFILPEDLLPGQTISADFSRRLGMVPISRVRGPLLARTFPPTRIRFY